MKKTLINILVVIVITILHTVSYGRAPDDVSDISNGVAQPQLVSARKLALEALRRGDFATAKSAIAEAIVARGDVNGSDVGMAEELTSLCFTLAEFGDRDHARELAPEAILALKKLESRQTRQVSLRAGLLSARLAECLLHNSAAAEAAYRRVLQDYSDNLTAKEGLARLSQRKALAAEKLREQQRILQEKSR